MQFESSDREVIRSLFASKEWLDLYELHEKYKLSPGQIVDIVDRLIRAGFAEKEGIRSRLTPEGRKWVMQARKAIFVETDRAEWRPDADAILGEAMDPTTPYLPDLELVDRGFFSRLGMCIDEIAANE